MLEESNKVLCFRYVSEDVSEVGNLGMLITVRQDFEKDIDYSGDKNKMGEHRKQKGSFLLKGKIFHYPLQPM